MQAPLTGAAHAGGQKKSAQLGIVPEGPSAISATPNPVLGGIKTKGLVEAIPGNDAFTVRLTSSNPDVASVPGFVSFTGGMTRQNVQVSTTPVAQDARVTISATTTSVESSPLLSPMNSMPSAGARKRPS